MFDQRSQKRRPTRLVLSRDQLDMGHFAQFAKDAHSDVQGSYTGDPLYDEQPVQDVDDL